MLHNVKTVIILCDNAHTFEERLNSAFKQKTSLAQSDVEIVPYYVQWRSIRTGRLGLVCDGTAGKGQIVRANPPGN